MPYFCLRLRFKTNSILKLSENAHPKAVPSVSIKPVSATPSSVVFYEHIKNSSDVVRDSLLTRLRNKGRETYVNMMKIAHEQHGDTGPQELEDGEWMIGDLYEGAELNSAVEAAANYIGIPEDTYDAFSSAIANWVHNANVFFPNMFNPTAGVIVAQNNRASAPGNRSPWHWSDVAWPMYASLAEGLYDVPAGNLRYIIRDAMLNEDTLAVLRWFIPRKQHHVFYKFIAPDDGFYALLQSPNGIGGAYICMNYATSLQFKTVQSIVVFWDDNRSTWTMIQQLG